ncbi:GNAT family N-acetyltransferase [Ktedonobacter robiniae]|uniref:N-acetyltransferase n=1 Tax=Ktedonobacter robiniae TaxID=2778365 RepID=A0ABQ3UW29_9CHLR|nr:GNAT family N-acetyltransferase [Ktedonobacter robiniae]GHO56792.1 N-acetyltransferase [Ktedonobacter robiniae]
MSTIQIFLHEEQPIDPHAVRELYTSVEWWPERTEEQIAQVLASDVAVGAWDGERLVGFARVVSDHIFHAYIEDVMIHPTYQRRGIGQLLVSRLLEALPNVKTITLFCQEKLLPFYEIQGFRAFPSQVVMHRIPTD